MPNKQLLEDYPLYRKLTEPKQFSNNLNALPEVYVFTPPSLTVRIHAPLLDTPTQPVNPLKPA